MANTQVAKYNASSSWLAVLVTSHAWAARTRIRRTTGTQARTKNKSKRMPTPRVNGNASEWETDYYLRDHLCLQQKQDSYSEEDKRTREWTEPTYVIATT
jgi:hypothetical protein